MRISFHNHPIRVALGMIIGLCWWAGGGGATALGQVTTLAPGDGWEYRWGDSPVDERGTPQWTYDTPATAAAWQPAPTLFNPPGEARSVLWLRIRLPEELPEDPVLGTRYIWLGVEAYLDSTRCYRAGELQPDPRNKYAGVIPHSISLPEDAGGRVLSLRIFSDHEGLIGIPMPVYLASEADLLRMALRTDLAPLLIGIILVVAGLLLLLLLLKGRERQRALLLFYLGLFSLCFGVQYVANHFASYFILNIPAALYYTNALFYLFPVGILGFFEQMIGAGFKAVIRRLWQGHLLFFLVAMVLDVMNVVPIFFLTPFFFALLTASLLALIITVVPAIRGGKPEARIFGIGLFIVVVLGLHDTLLMGFRVVSDAPALAPWGVLIFMLFLGYLVERRFTDNTRQLEVYARELEAANTQLEAYSGTLEQRVEARTHELKEKNHELADTLQRLQKTQDQLIQSKKLASLGQLTAGIAHEIKNPLNFVNNFAQLSTELAGDLHREIEANRDKTVAEVAADLEDLLNDLRINAERINKHGKRADGIVRSMLEHSRGTPGPRRATDVNTLLEEYVNLAYHGMRARHVNFSTTIERVYDEAVGEIEIVPQDIGRVFLNLLNNAFYAVHERAKEAGQAYKPMVSVRTRKSARAVEIEVQDNGSGIPEAMQDRVFEPFFTTKPAGSGTGLGLSISYEIVTRGHGGTLGVKSREGEGTVFTITLPTR
ncbi:MAG: ATP-binding protein [Rhodothermales bacterium]